VILIAPRRPESRQVLLRDEENDGPVMGTPHLETRDPVSFATGEVGTSGLHVHRSISRSTFVSVNVTVHVWQADATCPATAAPFTIIHPGPRMQVDALRLTC
jgi:hypothetical protein